MSSSSLYCTHFPPILKWPIPCRVSIFLVERGEGREGERKRNRINRITSPNGLYGYPAKKQKKKFFPSSDQLFLANIEVPKASGPSNEKKSFGRISNRISLEKDFP